MLFVADSVTIRDVIVTLCAITIRLQHSIVRHRVEKKRCFSQIKINENSDRNKSLMTCVEVINNKCRSATKTVFVCACRDIAYCVMCTTQSLVEFVRNLMSSFLLRVDNSKLTTLDCTHQRLGQIRMTKVTIIVVVREDTHREPYLFCHMNTINIEYN